MFSVNKKLKNVKPYLKNHSSKNKKDKLYIIKNTENGLVVKNIDIKEAYYNFLSQGLKNIFDKSSYPHKFKPLESISKFETMNE